MIIAIPLSSRVEAWHPLNPGTYPILLAGMAGLTKDSVALLDHLQGIDERRLSARLGRLPDEAWAPIRQELLALLAL